MILHTHSPWVCVIKVCSSGYNNNVKSGFYLRKKVAGSTLKIEGSIFRAKLRMGGPKAREGGEPERGVSPLLVGGVWGLATPKKILKIG